MPDTPAPALKEMFDPARFRLVAGVMKSACPGFDSRAFLRTGLAGLEPLSLLQRLRRMTECLHAQLPADYRKALTILRKAAPGFGQGFVTLVLPDFVGVYGRHDFPASMDALKFFTPFGSSEFAVREFFRLDPERTLTVMKSWAHDPDEAVRRLASEGSRPRLPWSFRLESLIADPAPVAEILETLRADPSLYVRKSVANHLNDITKDHPDWVLARVTTWPQENPHTAWIVRHALRTLIKAGDPRALQLIGASGEARVEVLRLDVTPARIVLGDSIILTCEMRSQSPKPQRLVVDYALHYPKKSGKVFRKVFKGKELTLAPGQSANISRGQTIRDFSTRTHHPGRHRIEILVNGVPHGETHFDLSPPGHS